MFKILQSEYRIRTAICDFRNLSLLNIAGYLQRPCGVAAGCWTQSGDTADSWEPSAGITATVCLRLTRGPTPPSHYESCGLPECMARVCVRYVATVEYDV
jgi:hypothetical protein